MSREHLLPPNATRLERDFDEAGARVIDVPVPLRTMWRPDGIPVTLLPWLAWALSVDVWLPEWGEEKRRAVAKRSFRLHKFKGTEKGLRDHVALTGAGVRQVVTPPMRTFASRTLTREEMDAWLRTMPQIRVYLAREKGSGTGLSFKDVGFIGHAFGRFDAGRALLGRAARLWDGGEEVPLNLFEITTEREARRAVRVERVSIRGKAGAALFAGRFNAMSWLDAAGAEPRLVTYRQDVTYEHAVSSLSMRAARVTFSPVDVRSERVSETGHAGPWCFARRFATRTFYGRDEAEWMMFDRVILHDPSRAVPRSRAWSFVGSARLGIARFTAETLVDLKTRGHARAMYEGGFIAGAHLRPEDGRRRRVVQDAMRVSKAARDRIMTTHQLVRDRTLGDGIPMDGSSSFRDRVPFRL